MTLTKDQLKAMCERGFGAQAQIESMEELGGGTFNTAYLITLSKLGKVILRIAPPQTATIAWENIHLMRSEHAMQPYFAPIATLMPKTLLVDFTHQLLDRDYIFQTFIEGERWDNAWDEFATEEHNLLWGQFGRILKQVHEVRGEQFGLPRPGFQFDRWSQAVLDRMERTLLAAQEIQLDTANLSQIIEIIKTHPERLDEIETPRLLHGDLWLFNLLISRAAGEPSIVGVLDADRSWWGDPMADWTMFILAHADPDEGHAHFWQAYGEPEDNPGARFRKTVYDGMHAATALVYSAQHADKGTVERAYGTLREVAKSLPSLLTGRAQ